MNLFSFVKSHVNILDVASEYSSLKKIGFYYKGQCPFHSEKTASFTVSPAKEIFYCFGCHVGGDVVSFMAKMENCSPIDAAKLLIERYQLTPPADVTFDFQNNNATERKHYYDLCKFVAGWAHENLIKNAAILDYLYKRGFAQPSIKLFNVGYFPSGPAAIKSLLTYVKNHNVLASDLIDAHILSEGKTTIYSPFEDRIIFPIKDHLGKHCGFGGRIFKEADQRPKYYNSHENEFFTKGSLLFGLDLAKKKIQEYEQAFLVEGYTDCMAMVQHGYANTVATLGTACTIEHLKQLARYAQRLFVVYDADKAGQQAMLRLTELCWQVSMELYVICLPANQDPCSFLTQGNSLDPLIEQAKDIFEFFIDSTSKEFANKPLSQKLTQIRKLIKTITSLEDPLKRDILLQSASKKLKIPIETLQAELRRESNLKDYPASENTAQEPEPSAQPALEQSAKLEKKIFCAIINNINLFTKSNESFLLEYLPISLRDILKRLKLVKEENASIDFMQFFSLLNESQKLFVSKLLLEHEYDLQADNFEQLLIQFHKKNWKAIVQDMKIKLELAKSIGDTLEVQKILHSFLELKQKMLQENII